MRHTREQEAKLARAAKRGPKAGRKAALEQLTLSVLPLAVSVASKFQGRGLPLEDLIGVANVAVMKAVKRFDPATGNRLTTFVGAAVWRDLRRAATVQPRAINSPQWMESEVGREGKSQSHADAAAAVSRMISLDAGTQSRFASRGDDGDFNSGRSSADITKHELLGRESEPCDLDAEERQVRRRKMLSAILALSAPEQHVMRGKMQGQSLRAIGQDMGVTKQRVRQVYAVAAAKLREMLGVEPCD